MGRRMRRLLALTLLAAALVLGGCGGGDDEESTPLSAALSYLPAESPFAIAIDSDLEGEQYKAVDAITARFPLDGTSVEELLESALAGTPEVDFQEDVKPLLGNPFVVGASDVTSFIESEESDDFVAALQVKDDEALDRLVLRSGAEAAGEVGDARKYESEGTNFAVDGDIVVLAGSERLLDAALERAEGDDHLDAQQFEDALEGLPEDAVARVYADVGVLIASDPETQEAKKVPWVAALRTLGMTASAREDEVELQLNLRTDPEGLSDSDLPIAAGEDSPPVLERDGEVGFGIRDPGQIARFAEAAGQAVDPAGFGDYAQAKKTLDSRLGIDIDSDLVGQLSGDLSASIALDGALSIRSELEDPAAFERTLGKVAAALPAFAEGAGAGAVQLERPEGDDPFYSLAQADGDEIVFGVAGGVFVLASDRERAEELVDAEPVPVDGAKGALTLRSDAQELVNEVIDRYGDGLGLSGVESLGARLFTDPFEILSGSLEASPDGLRGRLSVTFE